MHKSNYVTMRKNFTITNDGTVYRLLSPYEAREILENCQTVRTQVFAIRSNGKVEKLQAHPDVDIFKEEDPQCQFGLEVGNFGDIQHEATIFFNGDE